MLRITQQMMNNQMLNNLNNNLNRLDNYSDQLASGKKIRKPSDDPVGLGSSLRYRSDITANDQYERNLDTAISWMDYTDTSLGQISDLMTRAKELAVQGATESNSTSSRAAIASEIDVLYEELREIANSDFNGKHIFNGQRTDQPPYPNPDSWEDDPNSFDSGKIRYEVSKGLVMDINFHAEQIFGGSSDADNIFRALESLSQGLRDNDTSVIDNALGLIDSGKDRLLEVYAEVGAKTNRLNMINERLKDSTLNLSSLLSKTEDADIAEVITLLKMEENVYQASLSVGARIIQPSLLDFLR